MNLAHILPIDNAKNRTSAKFLRSKLFLSSAGSPNTTCIKQSNSETYLNKLDSQAGGCNDPTRPCLSGQVSSGGTMPRNLPGYGHSSGHNSALATTTFARRLGSARGPSFQATRNRLIDQSELAPSLVPPPTFTLASEAHKVEHLIISGKQFIHQTSANRLGQQQHERHLQLTSNGSCADGQVCLHPSGSHSQQLKHAANLLYFRPDQQHQACCPNLMANNNNTNNSGKFIGYAIGIGISNSISNCNCVIVVYRLSSILCRRSSSLRFSPLTILIISKSLTIHIVPLCR